MTGRKAIEHEIREVLDEESQAIPLSEKLFGPGGLFSRLASSEEERRTLVQSPLYKEAQRRFLDLQESEAKEFARVAEHAQALMSQGGYRLKLERVDATGGSGAQGRRATGASEREKHEEIRSVAPDGRRHP